MAKRIPAEQRFWSKVNKTSTCWLWMAGRFVQGYGMFTLDGKTTKAHRYAYELLVGPIPDGLVIDHQCHNADLDCLGGSCSHRACVNPDHLRVTTVGENTLASTLTANYQNSIKTECLSGHPYTEANTANTGRGTRCCRQCKADQQRVNAKQVNAYNRQRYAERRAQGMTPQEARGQRRG